MTTLRAIEELVAPFNGETRAFSDEIHLPPCVRQNSVPQVVPIVSGGMDSVTMLFAAIHSGFNVPAVLSFDYGQRHGEQELECARVVCQGLDIPHHVVDIRAIQKFLGGSALTDDVDVPDALYTAESASVTVVPNRNAIMLNIAAGFAQSLASTSGLGDLTWTLATAVHAGDHTIYKDCRPEFAEAVDNQLGNSTDSSIRLWTPFVKITKPEILKIGLSIGVPYEHTYTCYKGGETHCGTCPTCVERIESFVLNDWADPVEYATGGWKAGLEMLREGGILE